MTNASQIVQQLQQLIAQHGDLPVEFAGVDTGSLPVNQAVKGRDKFLLCSDNDARYFRYVDEEERFDGPANDFKS